MGRAMKYLIQFDEWMAGVNKDYGFGRFEEKDAHPKPVRQFQKWFLEALKAKVKGVSAMTLATAAKNGRPDARVVLLKGFDERGFVFFTNYGSAKGKELAANPAAALVFYWPELEREVRIWGRAAKVSRAESAWYFKTRDRDSQIGAWACAQSKTIESRAALERRCRVMELKFKGKEVPLPPFWGGYRVTPIGFEFWQGRKSRLNDRIRYVRRGGKWKRERLQP